ncbi:MAG: 4-hydroxy-tetrahydrodipicolinate reductase [Azospirillaceae bacterium]|nr:4-hydroxy-tetrahydrodipicolinate reductase [Azospirillaceae bacterium]
MKIGVVGCTGRMGQMLIRQIVGTAGCVLAGGVDRPASPAIGKDLGTLIGLEALGLSVGEDPVALFAASDAVIDFTVPAASIQHAHLAAQAQTILVVGTTGLSRDQEAELFRAARYTPIVQSANMSLGVNILLAAVEQVARALGPEVDIEILEMHHRYKVDAPSGTALALGRAAAAGRGVDLDQVAVRSRDGLTGPRRRGDIGFAALRGGDVVGDHSVIFAADGERVELSHRASDRSIFARGAVAAARWAAGKPPGLYGMRDVLGMATPAATG